MKRKCSNCGGPVSLSIQTITLQRDNPADPEHPLEITVRGLGTWHCNKPINAQCKGRTITVPRYAGAGKELERGSASRGHNNFKGMDISDASLVQVTVQRPIAVITHY